MIHWRIIGNVYKYNADKKKITVYVKGEHAEKLSLICKTDKKRFYFLVSVKSVKIKNELILKHTKELDDLVGMEIDMSGHAKKFRFKSGEEIVEGISLHADVIN